MTLALEPGEFFALLGGSGSGKSTLLRVIGGFEAPDAGRVTLAGEDVTRIPPHRRRTAMVFQSYALFPHLSVFDNVAYGLRREGTPPAEIAKRVAEALDLVSLPGFSERRPHQLSGGQQQRVAIARAIARRPALLLLDEPLGALDAGLRERTGLELRALQRRLGTSFVMVTHDQAEALALADRVAVLEAGRLAQVGTPRALWDRPATRSLARFLGGANIIEPTQAPLSAEEPAPAYALRPERIRLVPEAPWLNGAAATVEEGVFRGEGVMLTVRLDSGARLRVLCAGEAPAAGSRVALAWDAAALAPLPA
ncbi:MAG: ABC transporter ATP-binding protein [Acetobacteraceae bacterium]|nr:ABC transporter ATP-binding protein [Acetobacteraceae bacterium]